jgi:hypothetical protein
MRPTGQSLVTKGIQAIAKSISLSTKGVLDQLVRKGAESRRREFFEKTFPIIGIKEFSLALQYSIVGQKVTTTTFLLDILVKVARPILTEVFVRAVLSRKINEERFVRASRLEKFSALHAIIARKQFGLNTKSLLFGKKIIQLSENAEIKGIKEYSLNTASAIVGKKATTLHNDKIITGKRDIKNILLALDIFEE